MSERNSRSTQQFGLAAIACIAVLLLMYVASAAPVTRVLGKVHDAYRPVHRLTVDSPIGPPLRWWARTWGVEEEFSYLYSPVAREIEKNLGVGL